MNDKVPQALKDKQVMVRQATVHAVLMAIHELQAQGYAVRIKDLMEYTGLSRSTFSNTHVRELFVRCGIVDSMVAITATIDPNESLSA